ncbi:MAG: hypothetical protein KAI24_20815 [Planctomycetes bacterium]|nr:hypothetical protein [Planctomycetota bacterium]
MTASSNRLRKGGFLLVVGALAVLALTFWAAGPAGVGSPARGTGDDARAGEVERAEPATVAAADDLARHPAPPLQAAEEALDSPLSSELIIKVVDDDGNACPGADVFYVGSGFPDPMQLGIEPVEVFRSSVEELLFAHSQRHVAASDGTCRVLPRRGDGCIHAFCGEQCGKRQVMFEDASRGDVVHVTVRPRTDTTIRILSRDGAPVAGVGVGLVVSPIREPSRVHLLRKVTSGSGELTIGLSAIVRALSADVGQIERMAIGPYLPGCLRHTVEVDPANVRPLYVLTLPPCGALRVYLSKGGHPVDASGVMLREHQGKAGRDGDAEDSPDPWMPAAVASSNGGAQFEIVALSFEGYEVSVGGQNLDMLVEGPAYVGAVADHTVMLDTVRPVVYGRLVLQEASPLPKVWKVVFGSGGRSRRVVVGDDGAFSFPAPLPLDEVGITFWSVNRRLASDVVKPPSSEAGRDIFLGDVSIGRCEPIVTLKICDAESGDGIDASLLDVRAALQSANGTESHLRVEFTRRGECTLVSRESVGALVVGRIQSSVFTEQPFSVPAGASRVFRLARAGRVEVICERAECPKSVVLQGRSGVILDGQVVGRKWSWEGVPLGDYRVIEIADGQRRDVGGLVVTHSSVARLRIL